MEEMLIREGIPKQISDAIAGGTSGEIFGITL